VKPSRLRPQIPTEHAEQSRLIRWARYRSATLPELRMLVSIPNGGLRSKTTGALIKAEGARAGFPDLGLLVQRHGYGALFIEMKRVKGGRVKPEQKEWHDRLQAQGYRVEVCYGAGEAMNIIENYLEVKTA